MRRGIPGNQLFLISRLTAFEHTMAVGGGQINWAPLVGNSAFSATLWTGGDAIVNVLSGLRRPTGS